MLIIILDFAKISRSQILADASWKLGDKCLFPWNCKYKYIASAISKTFRMFFSGNVKPFSKPT